MYAVLSLRFVIKILLYSGLKNLRFFESITSNSKELEVSGNFLLKCIVLILSSNDFQGLLIIFIISFLIIFIIYWFVKNYICFIYYFIINCIIISSIITIGSIIISSIIIN